MTKLPKMNKVEMVRSDISGKLFPSGECEVIIIKIIKGKKEDINDYSPFARNTGTSDAPAWKEVKEKEVPKVVAGLDTASPEFDRSVHIRHSIIPKQMQDLFQDPTK